MASAAPAAGSGGSASGDGTMRYRPLHWVFRVGNLAKTMDFYTKVLGMKICRHEEFSEGCEATCNGPYGGAWSKTMIGWVPEEEGPALEITYNYGIESYKHGNDFRFIAISCKPDTITAAAKAAGYDVLESTEPGMEGTFVTDPDGAKFKLVDTGATEPSLFFVSLNVSSLAKAREYYTGAFQMQEFKDVPGASKVDSSMVVGFSDKQMRLELVEFTKEPIRFEEGKGRMATETHFDGAQDFMADRVKALGGKIVHGPMALPPHMERVVIVEDADGFEYCFVDATGFAKCMKAGVKTIDWDERKSRGGDGNPVPKIALKGPLNKMVVVEDDEGFEKAVADAGDKPIVIDCMASWCKKCAGVFPTVSELSGKHTDAVFLKVDVDECEDTALDLGVSKVPTFVFYKSGKVQGKYEGSDQAQVTEQITKFVSA